MRKVIFIYIIISGMLSADIVNSACSIGRLSKGVSNVGDLSLISKAGKLSKVTQKSFSRNKCENIQNLMKLAVKENQVEFSQHIKYIKTFNNIENGDILLLNCLKKPGCDLDNYSNLLGKSPLHIQIASKYSNLNLAQINHRVGSINENLMNKYFQSTGWSKIEGEVGRNGIDGLFIKRKKGVIIDVLMVESKYNKSGLQYTKHGQQMTTQWVTKKIENLQKKYPNNKDYISIKKFVENDSYRAMLWNLKTTDENLIISLKKIHDKSDKVVATELKGNDKMKINFNGNQEINMKHPKNNFHEKIISWYTDELKKYK